MYAILHRNYNDRDTLYDQEQNVVIGVGATFYPRVIWDQYGCHNTIGSDPVLTNKPVDKYIIPVRAGRYGVGINAGGNHTLSYQGSDDLLNWQQVIGYALVGGYQPSVIAGPGDFYHFTIFMRFLRFKFTDTSGAGQTIDYWHGCKGHMRDQW